MAFSQGSNIEKNALIELYESTQGEHWNTTWNLSQDVSAWYGIEIKNNTVVGNYKTSPKRKKSDGE